MSLSTDDKILLLPGKGQTVAIQARSANTVGNSCLLLYDNSGQPITFKTGTPAVGDRVALIPDKDGIPIAIKIDGIVPNPPVQTDWISVLTSTSLFNLEVLGTQIYLGFYDGFGGIVYKSSNGTIWTTSIDYLSIAGMLYPYALKSYGSYLYMGFQTAGFTNAGIYRTSDGSIWTQVYDTGTMDSYIQSIESHGGKLYANQFNPSGSLTILRSNDGSTWASVYTVPAATDYLFNLKSFGGFLYAYYLESVGGISKLWRCTDGTDWAEASAVVCNIIGSSGSYAFAAGAIPATYTKIYRSTNGTVWVEVQDCTPGTPRCFCECEDLFFVGSGVPEQIWYSEDNGATWNLSYTTAGATYFTDLAVFLKRVYGSTETNIYRSLEIK